MGRTRSSGARTSGGRGATRRNSPCKSARVRGRLTARRAAASPIRSLLDPDPGAHAGAASARDDARARGRGPASRRRRRRDRRLHRGRVEPAGRRLGSPRMGVARARRVARRLPVAWAALLGRSVDEHEAAAPDPAAVAEEPVHTRFPLGHYYSPVYDPRELAEEPRRSQIWPPSRARRRASTGATTSRSRSAPAPSPTSPACASRTTRPATRRNTSPRTTNTRRSMPGRSRR